jgi:MOSC domain-containing protein YiiM
MISTILDALLIGGPKPFRADGTMSAMDRQPATRPVMLRKLGFEGDQVGDPTVHGGADKAVHFYPAEHYPKWTAKLNGHALLAAAGAFGENLSASGLTEEKVKIGDQFRIGDTKTGAVVEVAQGRQPCWKIDHRFGTHGISGEIIRTGRCGLYFRVIEEGFVAAGDVMTQVYAAQHEWTVARTFRLLIGGGHRDDGAHTGLQELVAMETLAETWRLRAGKLASRLHQPN